MEEPYAATTACHLVLMLGTSFVTRACGMASQSSARICSRLASMIVLVTVGRPLHFPIFWRSSAITLALWGQGLSSWGMGLGLGLWRYGTAAGCRILSWWPAMFCQWWRCCYSINATVSVTFSLPSPHSVHSAGADHQIPPKLTIIPIDKWTVFWWEGNLAHLTHFLDVILSHKCMIWEGKGN